MADGSVTVEPATGPVAAIDNDAIPDGAGGTVFRQRTRLGGAAYHELAVVANTTPGTSDYGLVVRDVGLAAVLTALNSIFGAVDGLELTTDMIRVDADTINLSTDGLETLLAAIRDRLPAALDVDGGVKAHIQNTVPVTGTFFQATQPVSGTVTATGPLTDTQLRATPVPVSGTVTATTGGLTDTQLRATAVSVTDTRLPAALDADGGVKVHVQSAVPVTGTFFQATQPVSGTVTATGPLTDTQLRATAVPVSGTVTATGPLTDTQLRATPVPISGTVTATTGGLTDTQLRATPVPVSGTVNPTTPTTLRNGQITVSTSGTRVPLAGSTAVVAVVVQALSTNTGSIWIGDSTVTVSNGFELQPGQSTGIAIDNLSKVFVDATTNGDKACFIGS